MATSRISLPTTHTALLRTYVSTHPRARERDRETRSPVPAGVQEGSRFHGFATAIFSMDFRGIYIY